MPAFASPLRASRPLAAVLVVLPAHQAFAQDETAAVTLPEIVVIAPNRTPIEAARTGQSVTVLTAEDLAREPAPTLDRTLERVPGFAIANRGVPGSATEVSVRGFVAEDILLRIDGIEFADPGELRTQPDLGQILTGDAQRIEAVRGAQSALYGGEAAGGVIDIRTSRARGSGIGAEGFLEGGSFATFQGAASAGVGFEDWDFGVSAQGFRTSGFSAASTGTEDDGSRNITVAATGSFDATEDLTLGAAFRFYDRETDIDRVSRGNVIDAIGDTAASRIIAGRAYARLKSFDDRLVNEISVQQFDSRREFEQEVAGDSLFEGARTKVEYLGTFEATDQISLLAGADWTREAVDTDDPLSASSTITGGFGQAVITPIDAVTLTGALRYDSHSDFGGFLTWRVTAAWEARPGTVLRGAVGTAFRAPSNRELFSPEGPFGPVGNPDLEPEESIAWEVGIDQSFFDGRLVASGTYFESRTDELIEFVFGTGFDQVEGTSERRGAEIGLTGRLDGIGEAVLSYTYLDAEDPDGAPLNFAPRHDLTAAVFVEPIDRLTLGVRASYLMGVFDDDVELDPFLKLDLDAAYRITDQLETYVRVENLLDQAYERVDGFETAGVSAFAGFRLKY
ncbi:MAG: TonB-dependent receptor [Pseudomonadota bacterium]